MDETDPAAPAAPAAAQGAPRLRTLGDPDAAVCADGFCEVPGPAAKTAQTTTPSGANT